MRRSPPGAVPDGMEAPASPSCPHSNRLGALSQGEFPFPLPCGRGQGWDSPPTSLGRNLGRGSLRPCQIFSLLSTAWRRGPGAGLQLSTRWHHRTWASPSPQGWWGRGCSFFFIFTFFLVRHQGKQSHSFCNKAKRNPREQGTEPSWPQRAVFSCGSGTAPCFYLMHFIPKQNLFACDPAQEHPTWVGNPVLHSSGAAQGGCPPGHTWHPAEEWARVLGGTEQ